MSTREVPGEDAATWRKRDAALSDHYNDAQHGFFRGNTTDPERMRLEHETLVEAGLLDDDQPTPYTHYLYQQALGAEFTPLDRMQIRAALDCFDLSHLGRTGDES